METPLEAEMVKTTNEGSPFWRLLNTSLHVEVKLYVPTTCKDYL